MDYATSQRISLAVYRLHQRLYHGHQLVRKATSGMLNRWRRHSSSTSPPPSSTPTIKAPVPTGAFDLSRAPIERAPRDIFSFSGCGWMMPYHIGVAHRLVMAGRIRSFTKFAGASGGSLMGAYLACGVDPEAVMDAQLHQAEVCFREGTWWKLRGLLQQTLRVTLPEDAHEYCNGRLTVAVTRVWPKPRFRPIYIKRFHNKEDLIAALLASCMVPGYLEPSLVSRFRDMYVIDGGSWQLVPRIAGAIKVSPFTPPFPRHQGVKMDIHPGLTPNFPFTSRDLWTMVYQPSPPDVTRRLHDCGAEAAEVWLATSAKGQAWCDPGAARRWKTRPEEINLMGAEAGANAA
eukprot:TRINITY_DN2178_c0_g1_i2.p1 TRINITY_DN2178_c0_g1~~TRINITY_DN2178_c0_g1_i2.p1  ORF type:complete len:346 (+),score=33.39 TRINITY_DN2178_c0_g1_i2:205-1242(+)